MVALLELPDALAGVARVARDGDRPEGVGGLHDVRPLGPRAVGAAGGQADGERLEWDVVIWFPWDPERRLFRGEKVYVSGIDLPKR